MTLRPPPRIAGVTKKPSVNTKVMRAEPAMPDSVMGRNTLQKTRRRDAPSPWAASSTRSSTARMAEASGKTAKGISTCTIPTTTPNSLRTSCKRLVDEA